MSTKLMERFHSCRYLVVSTWLNDDKNFAH
jgi:hypothetical protein